MNTIPPPRFRSNRAGSHPFQDGVLRLITLLCALAFWPGSAFAQGSSPMLRTTFANPTPAYGDFFGASVAALENDRVLIGEGAGAAYLFSVSGALLTTFTISDPDAFDFGNPVLGVGKDHVLISSYSYGTTSQIGRAYFFTSSGSLLTIFTNPNPARVQAFGASLATLGNDRVLIGGPADPSKSAPFLASVYLFGTNGTLLTTITNPTPAVHNAFGIFGIAAVGRDRVIVGAPDADTGAWRAGVAYLFNTNGVLLNTFTNPAPTSEDNFGTAVAAVGNDRVLISANDYGRLKNGGAAYLFNTNGTLLTTFTNPTPPATDPATSDYFGQSVAAVGSTRVLIGAYSDDTGAKNAGSAYLFSTNGTLLQTITNPVPAAGTVFGVSVAAVGTSRLLIGTPGANTGAPGSGAAYLFDLPYPPLSIERNAAAVSLKWVTPETGLTLQESGRLGTPTEWEDTVNSASINGPTNVVQQTQGTTNRFYRLRRP